MPNTDHVITADRIESYRSYMCDTTHTNVEIREALRQAREWIGGLNDGLTVLVAYNLLTDGYLHA